MHVCALEPGGGHGVVSSVLSVFVFETGSHGLWSLSHPDGSAHELQRAPLLPPHSPPGITGLVCRISLLFWSPGIKLKSLLFCVKYLTDGVIS